ncbi:LysR family transcriptional regulator [Novosphingobium mangrovi (ex Hu et al. 2023)]|uniref:LysR family transcriptional regulator n=1 Tax=Novosphingobium mangrovi (ex Hu et al. 2023) TaxID=2930094 RepID=A0ABT0A7W0_9SPHN|nr:LysR family transcriptional regulator [Novosphingobium mangrovi (ex Hu et al. 2023)]MCJ1959282.1 LysR family transcriptional regulator [Novosphingobium mangrovi (ex Hu et al. 2023)]
MERHDLSDFVAFVTIARLRSFTRAAAQLGVTPSALSHRMKALEARLGIRLLNRTTRSVSPTEAGERLLGSVGAKLDGIEADIARLAELRDRPAGNIRVNSDELAAHKILWPMLRDFLPRFPDINVEVTIDNGFTDIVASGADAGVRLGGVVEKDMIGVAISPPLRMLAVAAPDYFAKHGRPRTPRDLVDHACLNYRFTSNGGIYAWEFEEQGQALDVRVGGQLIFNSIFPIMQAALDGAGIGCVLDIHAAEYLESGALEAVLEDYSLPFEGYQLYYPSRRQPTPAFSEFVKALHYRGR